MDLDYLSNKDREQYIKQKSIRKRTVRQINKILDTDCKGCFYAKQISKLLLKIS